LFSVLDPPTIQTGTERVMVGQNEDVRLECVINANPLDDHMINWTHESEDQMSEIEGKIEHVFEDNKSYLIVRNAQVADSGFYFCTVNNAIGVGANQSIFLIVKRKKRELK